MREGAYLDAIIRIQNGETAYHKAYLDAKKKAFKMEREGLPQCKKKKASEMWRERENCKAHLDATKISKTEKLTSERRC